MQDPEGFGFLILANGFRRARRYEEALEVCRAGLENHPDYLSARVALALILLEHGDRQEAQSEMEAILEASPTNLLARRVLANLYREDGNLKEAKKQFEEILWLIPGDAEALDALVSLDEEMAAGGMGRQKGPASGVETPPAAEEESPPEDAEVVEEEPLPEAEAAEDAPLLETEEEAAQDDTAAGPVEEAAEEPAPEAETLPAPKDSPFPELAGMDMSDPMYTRTLARLYEEQGNHKTALVTYRMVLKESPDDEAVQQKITALEQAMEFEKELTGSGANLASLISEETVQEGEADKPDEEKLDLASELLDLDEEGAVENGSAPGAGPSLEDIGGDDKTSPAERETEPPEAAVPAEAEPSLGDLEDLLIPEAESPPPAETEPPLGDLEDLLIPEAESPPPAEAEPPLGDLEDLLIPEAESPPAADSPPLEKDLADPEAEWLADLDEIASDVDEAPADAPADDPLGVLEQEAALPAPESPGEGDAKSAPGPETGREATIERLEGLLERIRAKSKKDRDS